MAKWYCQPNHLDTSASLVLLAMQLAEDGATYTQQRIEIRATEDEEVIAYLPWWGTKAEEDDAVTCDFGDYGFYGEWVED